MNFVFFTHSLVSCWNHGNAHFLRGVLRALNRAGHRTLALEPQDSWSRKKLIKDKGWEPIAEFEAAFGDLSVAQYDGGNDPAALVEGADVVVVHEWSEAKLIAALGRLRASGARFLLLFHDTHHRAVSNPKAARALSLEGYDGILAFGESLAEVYRQWGWGARAFVWHEAADTSLFKPPREEGPREGVVWIGNWGDDERTAELERFLFGPVTRQRLPLTVYGVRYPPAARRRLKEIGADYRGWLPNLRVPEVFARHLTTMHVPRRFYAERLAGIPTIRPFEAMACGIPLVSAPWEDCEGLFKAGRDYLLARSGAEAEEHLRLLYHDRTAWRAISDSGRATIRDRHTCAHRADELLGFIEKIGSPNSERKSA